MRQFYENDLRAYRYERTFDGFLKSLVARSWMIWGFYICPALTLPLLAFPCIAGDRKMRFPLIAGAVVLVGLTVETWMSPHYFAPAVGLLYLVLLQCMRHMRHWRWRGAPVGSALVQVVPLILAAMIILRVTAIVTHVQIELGWPRGNTARARIVQALQNLPGKHLILVRYSTAHTPDQNEHIPDDEWVYNSADIDHAKVVWARDMGERDNQEILQYFKGYKVWFLFPDEPPPRLEPLPGSTILNNASHEAPGNN